MFSGGSWVVSSNDSECSQILFYSLKRPNVLLNNVFTKSNVFNFFQMINKYWFKKSTRVCVKKYINFFGNCSKWWKGRLDNVQLSLNALQYQYLIFLPLVEIDLKYKFILLGKTLDKTFFWSKLLKSMQSCPQIAHVPEL